MNRWSSVPFPPADPGTSAPTPTVRLTLASTFLFYFVLDFLLQVPFDVKDQVRQHVVRIVVDGGGDVLAGCILPATIDARAGF
jgi:hypothetical protein